MKPRELDRFGSVLARQPVNTFTEPSRPVVTLIPVHVEQHTFVLTIVDGFAIELTRHYPGGVQVLYWFPPATPSGLAREAFETAGYSIEAPFARAAA